MGLFNHPWSVSPVNLQAISHLLSVMRKAIAVIIATVMPCGPVLAEAAESLFNEGLNATAIVGGTIQVPATRFPCASCHGSDGLGRREGGTRIPPVTGKYLTVETSERPAYTVDTFLKAVRTGVSPDGRELSRIMPRFDADESTLRALFQYLHKLDVMQRVGITPTTIAFKAPLDEETQFGFFAAMEDFNRQGGSYGRTLISTQEEEDYLLSADAVFESLDKKVIDAQHARLMAQARNDGVVEIDVAPVKSAAELNHLLEKYGLSYNASAPFLYISASNGPFNVSDSSSVVRKTGLATQQFEFPDDNDSAGLKSSGALQKRRIYTPVWSTESTPGPWLDVGSDVVIAGFDKQAILWALAQGVSADASRGYALSRLLFDAVLIGARNVTQAKLLETIETLDLESRVFIVRSEDKPFSRNLER